MWCNTFKFSDIVNTYIRTRPRLNLGTGGANSWNPFLYPFKTVWIRVCTIFHETLIFVSILETWWSMIVCGKIVCHAHTCAWRCSVPLLCLNQPFLREGQCLKAEECALMCREMKWRWLCFMLCIRYTVLGHLSLLILMNVHLIIWTLDMNQSLISRMRSLLFFFSLNLLKGDISITHYFRIKLKQKK